MSHSVSPVPKPQPDLPVQPKLNTFWSQAVSEPETLSGFCLEWIQDRAAISKGRPT